MPTEDSSEHPIIFFSYLLSLKKKKIFTHKIHFVYKGLGGFGGVSGCEELVGVME